MASSWALRCWSIHVHAHRTCLRGTRYFGVFTDLTSRPTAAIDVRLDLGAGFSLRMMRSLSHVRASTWDRLPALNPWLKSDWLGVFAPANDGGAGGPETRYLQFYQGERVIGQALLQRLPLSGMRFGPKLRPSWVGTMLGEEAWQFGQVLFSGASGAHFLPGYQGLALLSRARTAIASSATGCCWASSPSEPAASGIWLAKDLTLVQGGRETSRAWWPVVALPELAIGIPSAWQNFDGYLAALPSKYRTRLKRARGKFNGLSTRLLEGAEVTVLSADFDRLYEALVSRAEYVPFRVDPGYVARLKQCAPDRVELRGYFAQERLIGFSTLLLDGSGLALAHLASCDPAYNASHQLYLNMLADLLAGAIERGASELNFGRTATTIKSSLGALPREYASYVGHDGCLRHQLLGPVTRRTRSDGELVQRPFG